MNTQETSARTQTGRTTGEEGYTFVEVLIVVAVIAALSVGAFALFTGRGQTTEMTAVAQQVGQTIQSQQQLIFRGLRNGMVSPNEIAGSLNSLLAEHRFVQSVAAAPGACTGGGSDMNGLQFNLDPSEFDTTAEAGELQSIIHASIVNVFSDEDGNAYGAADNRRYRAVMQITGTAGSSDAAGDYLDDSTAALFTLNPPNNTAVAYACLDNT
ncbi:MAG: prepilin-type N-terminal cleavage/methylation domain-containing protein [Bacteroidetes bacterium SB0662_bin_6]|nr:prepilin-type N-terminal cleavage/methylation domain-containing protein [Bacteroidetes bacterium SB0662_bin_6]MYI37143.1 prepilin-type N-terminal cleavage/methylation domain-containing protein [Acidimicrobiaceae bacterium]